MVKTHSFFIHLHPYSSIRIYQQKRLAKNMVLFSFFYAQISCKNDWNNFLLLITNAPLSLVLHVRRLLWAWSLLVTPV